MLVIAESTVEAVRVAASYKQQQAAAGVLELVLVKNGRTRVTTTTQNPLKTC